MEELPEGSVLVWILAHPVVAAVPIRTSAESTNNPSAINQPEKPQPENAPEPEKKQPEKKKIQTLKEVAVYKMACISPEKELVVEPKYVGAGAFRVTFAISDGCASNRIATTATKALRTPLFTWRTRKHIRWLSTSKPE